MPQLRSLAAASVSCFLVISGSKVSLREPCVDAAAFGCQDSGRASSSLEKAPSRWPGWRPWPGAMVPDLAHRVPQEAKPGQGSRAQTCSEPSRRRGGLRGRASCQFAAQNGQACPPDARIGRRAGPGPAQASLLCEQAPHIHPIQGHVQGLQHPSCSEVQTVVLAP